MSRHHSYQIMGIMGALSMVGLSVLAGERVLAAPPECGGATLSFSEDFEWMVGSATYQDPDGDEESGSRFQWYLSGQAADQGLVGELLFLAFDGDGDGAGGETPVSREGLAFQPGRFGQALALGQGGLLSYPVQGNLDLSEGTVSLWVALRQDGSDQVYSERDHVLLAYEVEDGDTWRIAQSDNGTLYAGGTVDGDWQSAYSSTKASMKGWRAGEWHHLVFTYSASGDFMRFYLDGVLAADTNEGHYHSPSAGSDVFFVGGDRWGHQAAYLIDSLQIFGRAFSQDEVSGLYHVAPRPFAVLLPTSRLQVGDTVSFEFTPSDGQEFGQPCRSDEVTYPGIPVVHPDPPSTILPHGAESFTLSVDTVTDTEVRYSIGEIEAFEDMTPFQQGAGSRHHSTTIEGIDTDPNVVTRVFVRCAAYPDFVLPLKYRDLGETDPGFPRTGNLWGSWNYCHDDIADCARVDLWLGANFSADDIRRLRSLNPNILVLTSINTIENKDLPEDYYLHDIHGNRIETWPGSFRLNVTKPYVAEYQAHFAYQKILDNDLMYDGCFFDNFMTTQSYWDHDIYGNPFEWDYNEDGVVDDPDDLDAAWRQGVMHEMDTFIQLMPNALITGHSMRIDEPGIAERFHGISIGFWTADVLEGRRSFDDLLALYEAWNDRARTPHITMVESSPPDQIAYGYDYSPKDKIPASTLEFARTYYPYVRFGLAFVLMNDGYFAHEFGDTWHGNKWWYDELDFDLGHALGPAQEVLLGNADPAEMLTGGDFEGPIEESWDFYVNDATGCGGTLTRDETDAEQGAASAKIDVPAVCEHSWYVELAQDLPHLQADQPYILRFWAKAASGRTLRVIVQQNRDPWTNYGLNRTLTLTQDWAEYKLPFTAVTDTDEARLEFLFAEDSGTVWLDDLRMSKRSDYVLRRDFEKGVVLLNPLRHAQVVPLEDGLRRLLGDQAPRVEYLLDDDSDQVSFEGTWEEKTLDSGEWKASGPFFHDWGPSSHLTSEQGAQATYSLTVPESGRYHVAAWWPAAPEASGWSQAVQYEILVDGESVSATTMDQTREGDQWHEFAVADLDPGQVNQVRITCGSDGPCLADALHVWTDARYNDGSPVSEVRLAPMDGIVLARIDVVGMPDGGLGDGGQGGADGATSGGASGGCGCAVSPGGGAPSVSWPFSADASLVLWFLLGLVWLWRRRSGGT